MNHWPNIFVLFCYLHYGPQTILCYFFSLDFTNRSDYWWLGFRVSPKLSFTHVRDWLIGPVQIYGPNCILKNNSNIIFILAHHLIHLDWPLTLHPKFSHPHAFQYNITLSNIISSQYYSNQNTTKHLSSHLIISISSHYFLPFLPLYKLQKSINLFLPTTIITYPFI